MKQVGLFGQFTGGVTFDGQEEIVATHAVAVVGHVNSRRPPARAVISTRVAPASRLFSTSSLRTEAAVRPLLRPQYG